MVRLWWRRARLRSAYLVASAGSVMSPGRSRAQVTALASLVRDPSTARSWVEPVRTRSRIWSVARGPRVVRRGVGDPQDPDRFHQAVRTLRDDCGLVVERIPGSCLGVDSVGFAPALAHLTIGSVDLHHRDPDFGEIASQPGIEGPLLSLLAIDGIVFSCLTD